MASEVRAKLCLVVDLIPDDGVRLARRAGGSNGKDEAAIPGHQQQLQNLRDKRQRPKSDFSVGQRPSFAGEGFLPRAPPLPASRGPK